MNLEQLRTIGVVVGAHGLQGSLKIDSLSDFPERFGVLRTVFLVRESKLLGEYLVKNCRWANTQVILTLQEIRDRNEADLLRQAYLCVRDEESWPLPKDSFFISDLIGFRGVDEKGATIGTLIRVLEIAQNVLEFERVEGENLLVPFVNEWVGRVDDVERTIELLNWRRLIDTDTIERSEQNDDH